MNLLELLHDSAVRFSAMTSWGFLLAKTSAVLAVAWLVHFALARLNPRWRVFLWRGTVIGLALLGVWAAGLPGFVVRVQPAAPAVVTNAPAARPVHSPSDPAIVSAASVRPRMIHDSAEIELQPIDREAPPDTAARTTEPIKASHLPAVSWESWLLGIWGLGALMLFLPLAIAYVRLARLLKHARPAPEAIYAEARRIGAALDCRRNVRILVSRRFAVPFVCGVRRPAVVLPEAWCDAALRGELAGVLAHELAHVRSHDVAWNASLQLFSIVFWFHPLAWRAGSAHRAACDAVCDAVSASYLGDVQAYRRTLARVALSAATPAVSIGLAMARSCDVRRRLAALERKVFGSSLRRRSVAFIAIVGLSALGLLAGLRLALAAPPAKTGEDRSAASAVKKDAEKTSAQSVPQKANAEPSTRPGFRPLRIQTFDEAGKPLVGAGVTVRGMTETVFGPFRYKTNAEGDAVIDVPREGASNYQILVLKNGYVTVGAAWDVHGRKVQIPEKFTFSLQRGTVLGGLVHDEQGKPIGGVEVTVEGRKSTPNEVRWTSIYDTVTTDAQGKWRVNRVPKDLTGFELSVTLRHAEFGVERFDLQKLPLDGLRAQTASLILRKGVAVEGTVTKPDGKPAAGAAVGLVPEQFGSDFPKTKTDQNGRYRIAVIEPGQYTVAAAAEGFVPDWKEITVGKERRTADLRLGKGAKIRLRIVDQAGKPLPGIHISTMFSFTKSQDALMLDYQRSPNNPAYHSPTDAEGRWSRLWIPNDTITFYIQKEGYATVQKSLAPDEREQVITLQAGVWSVSGHVVDKETKAPVRQFRVTEGKEHLGDNETIWYESRPISNANGEYRVTWNMPDERRVICIEADGYYPSPAQSLGRKQMQVTCNVELKKGKNITGLVRSPDGKLLADVDVVLCTPGRGFSFRNGRVGTDQYPLLVRTGADGRFSFPPQNDPCLLVAAHELGFAQVDDAAAMKEITLQPWARVEGTVTIDGKPGLKETVQIDYDNLWSHPLATLSPKEQAARRIFHYFQAETDAAGHFVLDRVQPGKAKISRAVKLSQDGPMSSWTSVSSRSIDLLPGQTLTVSLSGLAPAEIRDRATAAEKSQPAGSCRLPNDPKQENRIKAALKVLQAKPPVAQEKRIEAALEIFRNGGRINVDDKPWATAVRELIEIGKPAVPKLTAELDRTESNVSLRALGFVLRGIGDPRAVPALIRAIPRLSGTSGSDCGLFIKDDPELTKFMKWHDNAPQDKSELFFWGRPLREILPALEKITGESQGWLEINFADNEGSGIQQVRIKRTLFLNHARKWADWWSKNWQRFVSSEADAQIEQTRKALDFSAASIAMMPRQKPLTEIPCGPRVAVSGGMSWGQMRAFNEYPRQGFLDLDSGRIPLAPEELLRRSPGGEPSQELTDWAEREGVDLIVVKVAPPGGDAPYYALKPLGMKVWRIDNDRFDNLQNELRYTNKVELPQPWRGNLAQIDEKTDKYDERMTASFLFITKQGICGAVQIRPGAMPSSIIRGGASRDRGGWSIEYIYENSAEK